MGVHGLWDIVGPSARPVRVEALRNKRLAVDASIWIYQFLKAVRDKEGNQLKNSHIVGFLRRICKLLYFGIKPVFIFDGGVPNLKKDTIRKRKEKREDNKESIEQIAQKILAKQLQLFADGKLGGTPKINSKSVRREIPTNEIYFDTYYDDQIEEVGDEQENTKSTSKDNDDSRKNEARLFKGQDDYDLPNSGPIKVKETDNRVMTSYEYDRLTKDINDDLDGIDLDKINPQSKEFERLPLSTQYIVLSHLRLRSRLRMGYTKEQLQTLFPDPMEFSKFQIQMVQKRNFFTQKVMNVTGMDGDSKDDVISRRIASDKNRAYDLKRTGNGYALSISKEQNEGDNENNPIFLGDINDFATKEGKSPIEIIDSDENDDIDWDDVEVIDSNKNYKVNNVDDMENKTDKIQKEKNFKVENPLFIKDSDDELISSDEESVEMEDVPLDGISIINKDNEINGANNNDDDDDDDDDDVMKKIKYLYEYSDKHNKKKSTNEQIIEVPSDDEDLDEYQEIQIKQIEDEELRQAIEKSKNDYLDILSEEKSGVKQNKSLDNEAPIILSLSTLSKSLGIPNFSLKNNLLFGGASKDKPQEEGKDKKSQHQEEKIKKLQPLPDWFSSETNFNSKSLGNEKRREKNLTEDEKAGLVSYGEIDNYLSSDEEKNVEIIDLDKPSIEFERNEVSSDDEMKKVTVIENVIENVNKTINLPSKNIKKDVEQQKIKSFIDDNNIIELSENDFSNITEATTRPSENEEKMDRINVKEKVNKGEYIAKNNEIEEKNKQNSNKVRTQETDHAKELEKSNATNISELLDGKSKTKDTPQLEDEFEFSDDDEINLMLDMEEENIASENFFNRISNNSSANGNNNIINNNDNSNNNGLWTFTDETALQERLRKQKRDSDEVSTKMINDVQDLLARFGIPFITAPMEAEAQCAELELLGLVDGIITDDSDCFLFGGDKIYKNLFSEKNFVECYQDDDIFEEIGLNRRNMIELAILLGSDYTEGLKGIGKVMAMEILGEFKNLENFKNWWIEYQNGKIDEKRDNPLRKKIRKSLSKKLFLNNNFPNKLIYEAYLHPEVDHDKTEFKWGYPDIDKLRTFLMYNVGWNKEKIDEILIPVLKSLAKPQSTIEEFFPLEMIQRRRQLDMSKRIKNASERLKRGRKGMDNQDNDINNNNKKHKT